MHDVTRQQVAAVLDEAHGPMGARELAAALGLHVTTVRYHLDRLVESGRAVRVGASKSGVPGRPELRYLAVNDDATRAEILAILAELVDRRAGSGEAVAAGHAWAESVRNSGDDGAAVIERELAVRGFAPQRTATGLDLHACPFREAARRSPDVICGLHLGLAQGLASRSAGGWSVDLMPFVADDLCAVVLSREGAA